MRVELTSRQIFWLRCPPSSSKFSNQSFLLLLRYKCSAGWFPWTSGFLWGGSGQTSRRLAVWCQLHSEKGWNLSADSEVGWWPCSWFPISCSCYVMHQEDCTRKTWKLFGFYYCVIIKQGKLPVSPDFIFSFSLWFFKTFSFQNICLLQKVSSFQVKFQDESVFHVFWSRNKRWNQILPSSALRQFYDKIKLHIFWVHEIKFKKDNSILVLLTFIQRDKAKSDWREEFKNITSIIVIYH